MIRFITSLVTVFVLIAIDSKAPGRIPEYGDLMRIIIWTLVALNTRQMYVQVVEYANDEENAHERI